MKNNFCYFSANKNHLVSMTTGLLNKNFQHKNINIFLPIILCINVVAQKNHLIETVLLGTYNLSLVLGAQKNCLIETVLLSTRVFPDRRHCVVVLEQDIILA